MKMPTRRDRLKKYENEIYNMMAIVTENFGRSVADMITEHGKSPIKSSRYTIPYLNLVGDACKEAVINRN